MYLVTKRFVNGILGGLVTSDMSPVPMTPGEVIRAVQGSSDYEVVECRAIEEDTKELS